MASQEFPTFGPLIGTFVVLAMVAMRTGDHDVLRAVRTALIQRDDVINVEFATYLFPAIVAFALLGIVLARNIIGAMRALCGAFAGAVVVISGVGAFRMLFSPIDGTLQYPVSITRVIHQIRNVTARLSRLTVYLLTFSILSVINALVRLPLFAVRSTVNGATFPLTFKDALIVGRFVLSYIRQSLFTVVDVILRQSRAYAGFTSVCKTVAGFAITMEVFFRGGQESVAFRAASQNCRKVKHSVSLSLYHRMLSADGVISRRSVANLADNLSIPQS